MFFFFSLRLNCDKYQIREVQNNEYSHLGIYFNGMMPRKMCFAMNRTAFNDRKHFSLWNSGHFMLSMSFVPQQPVLGRTG